MDSHTFDEYFLLHHTDHLHIRHIVRRILRVLDHHNRMVFLVHLDDSRMMRRNVMRINTNLHNNYQIHLFDIQSQLDKSLIYPIYCTYQNLQHSMFCSLMSYLNLLVNNKTQLVFFHQHAREDLHEQADNHSLLKDN